MKIFGLGIPELLIILVVILLIFGPKNLPKLGASIGKAVKSLRSGMGGNKEDEQEEGAEIVDMSSEDEGEEQPVKHTKKVVVKRVPAK